MPESSPPVLSGACLCGQVRYELLGPISLIEYCHCSQCRKASGSAFSSTALIESQQFKLLSGEAQIGRYASSPQRLKCFCKQCGSPLFIQRLNRPEILVLHLGSLDGDPVARPERHVFCDSKATWHEIAGTLPQFKIYPGFEPAELP